MSNFQFGLKPQLFGWLYIWLYSSPVASCVLHSLTCHLFSGLSDWLAFKMCRKLKKTKKKKQILRFEKVKQSKTTIPHFQRCLSHCLRVCQPFVCIMGSHVFCLYSFCLSPSVLFHSFVSSLLFILTFAHQYNVCRRIRPLIWPWAVDFRPAFRIPASIWNSEHNKLCVCLCVWLAKANLDNQKNSRARLPGVWLQGKLISGGLAHPSAGHGSLMLFCYPTIAVQLFHQS